MAKDEITMALDGFSTPKVDTQDLAYQADPAFLPDKESHWSHAPEEDGWYRAHNAIRHELREFLSALESVGDSPLAAWQVKAMQAWWSGHQAHVHSHHSNEDDLFNPFLRTRINYPDKLETDHEGLVEQMQVVAALVEKLAIGENATGLRVAWGVYVSMMEPHLYEEEVVGVPLMRAYFTPKEIGALVAKILKRSTPLETGGFVHALGGKREARAFMRQEHIPGFVWYLAFKGARTTYRKKMQSQIDSLREGRPLTRVSRTKEEKAMFAPHGSGDENAANGGARGSAVSKGAVVTDDGAPRSPLGVKQQLLPVRVKGGQ